MLTLFTISAESIYNLMNFPICRVGYFLPESDVVEFVILVQNDCLLLHAKIRSCLGFLHVCDWPDAANAAPFLTTGTCALSQ